MSTSFFSCDDDKPVIIPECFQTIIDSYLMTHPPQDNRANLVKYLYNGNEVFELILFNSIIPTYTISTLECEILCSFGGVNKVTENSDCPNFSENATVIEIVWTDPR